MGDFYTDETEDFTKSKSLSTMDPSVGITVSVVRETIDQLVHGLPGAKVVIESSLGINIGISSLDVISAVKNGSADDVKIQSGGFVGSVAGSVLGSKYGAMIATAFGPEAAPLGAVIGAGAGAYWGEKKNRSIHGEQSIRRNH